MYPVILINASRLQSDDGIIGGGRGQWEEESRMAAGGGWGAKGAGQRSAEGERRNCAAPSSACFSGRMAGASFPRDPRRNAKRGIARVGRKSRDLTTIHTPPYVRTTTIRVLFTPPPSLLRKSVARERKRDKEGGRGKFRRIRQKERERRVDDDEKGKRGT